MALDVRKTLGAVAMSSIVSLASVSAQTLSFQPVSASDQFLRLPGSWGYSASVLLSGDLRIYASSIVDRTRWDAVGQRSIDLYGDATLRDQFCPSDEDPRDWDSRCIDSIGLFEKASSCAGGQSCLQNDLWDAHPGSSNFSTALGPTLWPMTSDHGVSGFTPIIRKDEVNAAYAPIQTGAGAAASRTIHSDTPTGRPIRRYYRPTTTGASAAG